jgi:undecaprenyl-diphosphatase
MFEFFHNKELFLIKMLQSIRSPFMDSFFCMLNNFDKYEYYIPLVIAIWFCVSRKLGRQMILIVIAASFVNKFAKLMFMQPRPFDLNPSLGVIKVEGYGFPSGAAQLAVILSGMLIAYYKNNKLAWIIGLTYVFLISLSRVYLGVHFPTDILGGWIIGMFMLFVFSRVYENSNLSFFNEKDCI